MKVAVGVGRPVEMCRPPDGYSARSHDDHPAWLGREKVGMATIDKRRSRRSEAQRYGDAATPDEDGRRWRPAHVGITCPPLDPCRRVLATGDPRPSACLEMNPPPVVKWSPTPRVIAAPRIVVSVDPATPGHIGHEARARFGHARRPYGPIDRIFGPRAVRIQRGMELLQCCRIGVAIGFWARGCGRRVGGVRASRFLRRVRWRVDRVARVSARGRKHDDGRHGRALEQLACRLSFQHADA